MANSIYRRTANTVQGLPTLQNSINIDWTQDVARVEQEAMCGSWSWRLDWCPDDLPLWCLRGQTYDGAANVSKGVKGVQAVLREKQPLALYVRCRPHCVILVTQTACSSAPFCQMHWIWSTNLTLSTTNLENKRPFLKRFPSPKRGVSKAPLPCHSGSHRKVLQGIA